MGLQEKYGMERIRETPISETAILGSAIGAAATGMRPIASLMYVDFFGVCGDELINQLQMRYMTGGQVKLPLTITGWCGARGGSAHQHAKNLFGWLMAIPGLKLVLPTTPYDAKGLLKTAIRDDNPVVILSHKAMVFGGMTGEVPEEEYTIPFGKADVKRAGDDVTVVATSSMVHEALDAAATLQERNISLEVIDPRTLIPLDKQTILDSVEKTGRLVVMSEEPKMGSAAGEIVATVAEEGFDFLDAPIKRVCAPDTPIPFSPSMKECWMPDQRALIKAISEMM
jgi:pyruvate dehydrogenase E1 component beta subunit